MDWIKKNYDRFILAVFAVLLIGVAVMLFLSAQSFGEKFSDAMSPAMKSDKVPEVDAGRIAAAKKHFEKPITWESDNHGRLLFTSESYAVKPDGTLGRVDTIGWPHSRTAELIPNSWFMSFGFSVNDSAVRFEDPDQDGFLNEDEFLAKTDPTKKDSHPPYYTQLFLKTWIKLPFRLKFQAYDGDPKKDAPEKMTFQINTLDLRQPTEFLKIGDIVANTKFKIQSFKFNEVENPSTGVTTDVSELTLVNIETGEPVTLILNKIVDSPNQFGEFEYRWNKKNGEAGQKITVAKLKEFVLQPEVQVFYKLLDLTEQKAVIQPVKPPNSPTITIDALKK